MDLGREALAELRRRRIDRGEQVLTLLLQRGTGRTAELAEALDITQASCAGVLGQLREAGFVSEITEGRYTLTGRGSAAAEKAMSLNQNAALPLP